MTVRVRFECFVNHACNIKYDNAHTSLVFNYEIDEDYEDLQHKEYQEELETELLFESFDTCMDVIQPSKKILKVHRGDLRIPNTNNTPLAFKIIPNVQQQQLEHWFNQYARIDYTAMTINNNYLIVVPKWVEDPLHVQQTQRELNNYFTR